jgi:hypothetical protein
MKDRESLSSRQVKAGMMADIMTLAMWAKAAIQRISQKKE